MHIQKWYALHNFFDDEKVERILDLTKSTNMIRAGVVQDGMRITSRRQRNCKSGWIQQDINSKWLFDEIGKAVRNVNDRTLKFDLADAQIEPLQYLEYGPLEFYGEHVDNGADPVSCRKYSVSIQLSHPKEYWGGYLKIRGEGQSPYAPRERGSMAVFPSHLLHQARPVWLGKRKVLVAWIRGKTPLS